MEISLEILPVGPITLLLRDLMREAEDVLREYGRDERARQERLTALHCMQANFRDHVAVVPRFNGFYWSHLWKIHHDLRLPNGHQKDLRNKCLSTGQKCRFSESELTPLKTALSRSFSDPKQGQSLEIIFKIKFPDRRFARMPDYSTRAVEVQLRVAKQARYARFRRL